MMGAITVSDDIRTREAQGEHIGSLTLSQAFILDRTLRHAQSDLVTIRVVLYQIGRFLTGLGVLDDILDLRLYLSIILLHPVGQFVHVVSTGDEAQCFLVKPVGGIGTMTGGKDGGTVLEGHTDHLRLPVRGRLQLITDRCHLQVPR